MKRRNLLAFLGVAPIAGPGIARAAVLETVRDLELQTIGVAALDHAPPHGMPASTEDNPVEAMHRHRHRLGQLLGYSAEREAFERRRTSVYGLDPDLAGYRSMSLGFRMQLQRDRNFERSRDHQVGWFRAKINGLLGADEG